MSVTRLKNISNLRFFEFWARDRFFSELSTRFSNSATLITPRYQVWAVLVQLQENSKIWPQFWLIFSARNFEFSAKSPNQAESWCTGVIRVAEFKNPVDSSEKFRSRAQNWRKRQILVFLARVVTFEFNFSGSKVKKGTNFFLDYLPLIHALFIFVY